MKTAYELAMERLNRTAPMARLSAEQKKQLAELDQKYAAKLAEREISLQSAMAKAAAAGKEEEAEQLRQTLAEERRNLQAELEAKKEKVRRS